jgi:hypothetical protein
VLEAGQCPDANTLKQRVAPETIAVPVVEIPAVDLTSYDHLLTVDLGVAP